MHGITRKGVDSAGGAQLAGGQDFVKEDGNLIVLLGDPVTPHAPGGIHAKPPLMAEGSSFVRINGIPVCREGHSAECGHVTTGSSWVKLSD